MKQISYIIAKPRRRALMLILIISSLLGSTAWAGAGISYLTTGDFIILDNGWAPHIADAARLLMDEQTADALLRHWSILLLRRSLTTDSPLERPQAAVALMATGDPAGIRATNEIVRHGDYLSKILTIQRLAESGSAGVRLLAAQCARQTGFASLALESRVRFDDSALIGCLIPALNDNQLDIQLLASIALSHAGDGASASRMRLLWYRVADPVERGMLAAALFELGDRSLLAEVRHDLACGRSVDSRKFAALALGRVNQPAAHADLVKALDDPAIEVRLAAAAALSRLGDTRGLYLFARAVGDSNGYPHWLLESCMDEIDVGIAWDVILRAAHSPDSGLRMAAVRAIASRRNLRAEQVLLRLLPDERDSSVRAYIVWGLGRIGSPLTIAPLTALLADDSSSVRCEAAIGLLRLVPAPQAGR